MTRLTGEYDALVGQLTVRLMSLHGAVPSTRYSCGGPGKDSFRVLVLVLRVRAGGVHVVERTWGIADDGARGVCPQNLAVVGIIV